MPYTVALVIVGLQRSTTTSPRSCCDWSPRTVRTSPLTAHPAGLYADFSSDAVHSSTSARTLP